MESIRGNMIQVSAGKVEHHPGSAEANFTPIRRESSLSSSPGGSHQPAAHIVEIQRYADIAMIDKLSVQMKLKGENIYKHDQQYSGRHPGSTPWMSPDSKIMFTSTLYSNTLNA